VVNSKRFDKRLPNCFTTAIAVLTERTHSHLAIGDWEAEENGTDEGKGRQSLVRMHAISVEEEAIFVQSYK